MLGIGLVRYPPQDLVCISAWVEARFFCGGEGEGKDICSILVPLAADQTKICGRGGVEEEPVPGANSRLDEQVDF